MIIMNLFDLPLEQLKVYKPQCTKEVDFNEFWNENIKKSINQPLNEEISLVDYPVEGVKVHDIYFNGFENSRIYAKYLLPKHASETNKVPAIAIYHGYNWNTYVVSQFLKYTLMGYAVLIVDVRGQNIKSSDCNQYDTGEAAGWLTKGILNPWNYYYKYVYMDAVRAVEFLASREEIDINRIAVEGGSQGGGLSLAVAALSDKVKLAMVDVPFLCHFRRAVEVSQGNPYAEISHYFMVQDSLHSTEEQVYKTLSYFDNMNLCTRIKGDVLLSVGLQDTTCPPSTVFAAYNNINSYKEIKVYPDYAHGGFTFQEELKISFIKERFN